MKNVFKSFENNKTTRLRSCIFLRSEEPFQFLFFKDRPSLPTFCVWGCILHMIGLYSLAGRFLTKSKKFSKVKLPRRGNGHLYASLPNANLSDSWGQNMGIDRRVESKDPHPKIFLR
jgi:hypothetical protein